MHCLMEVERIPGQDHFAVTSVREVTAGTMRRSQGIASSQKIDIDLVDFTDFYCPSCRRLGVKPSIRNRYFGCGNCGSIVCNGRSTEETNARGRKVLMFRCHPECGTVSTCLEGQSNRKWQAESMIAPPPGGFPQLPDASSNTLRIGFEKRG